MGLDRKQSDYNGFPNWETWHTALLIDNEEELHRVPLEMVRKGDRQGFKAFMREHGAEPSFEYAQQSWPDEQNDEVDYDFLWQHYADQVESNREYENTQVEEEAQENWPDTLPWGEDEQEYYRTAFKMAYKLSNVVISPDTWYEIGVRYSDMLGAGGWESGGGEINEDPPSDLSSLSPEKLQSLSKAVSYILEDLGDPEDVEWYSEHWGTSSRGFDVDKEMMRSVPELRQLKSQLDEYSSFPDTLPWGEDEQEYYRTAMEHLAASLDMPQFRDPSGSKWVWDADSKSYVQRGQEENHPDKNHASGGDNEVQNPTRHFYKEKNPLQEGILANKQNGHEADCECEKCAYLDSLDSPPMGKHYDAFPDRTTKPNRYKTDNTFPSMSLSNSRRNSMSRKDFSHVNEEHEHSLHHAAELDSCPECGDPMTNHSEEAVCHSCGHKQPSITVQAMNKEAIGIPGIDTGISMGDVGKGVKGVGNWAKNNPMDAALMATMFVPGVGPVASLGGRAALAGGKAMAGRLGAGAVKKGIGRAAGGAKGALNKLPGFGKGKAPKPKKDPNWSAGKGTDLSQAQGQGSTALAATKKGKFWTPGRAAAGAYMGTKNLMGGDGGAGAGGSVGIPAAMMASTASSDNDFGGAVDIRGIDDHPEHMTKGFINQHGDSPELLKDVNDIGGTKQGEQDDREGNDGDYFDIDEWDINDDNISDFIDVLIDVLDDNQMDALHAAHEAMPLIIEYSSDEEMDGSEDEKINELIDILEDAFPGYRLMIDTDDDGEMEYDSEESDDDDHAEEDYTDGETDDKYDEEDDEEDNDMSKESNALMGYGDTTGGDVCPECGVPHPPGTPHKQDTSNDPASSIGTVPGQAPAQTRSTSIEAKMAARLPRNICPFHKELVEMSLATEDPLGALGVMNVHMFGEKSCKGDWKHPGDKKCRFKSEMITKSFWDNKTEQAEQRRLEREQLKQQQEAEAPPERVVEEYEINPEPTSEETLPEGHSPVNNGESAIADAPAGQEMVASVSKWSIAEVYVDDDREDTVDGHDHATPWQDENGDPLREGESYKLKAPDYEIPDDITIDEIHSNKLVYTIHTDSMDFQNEMDRKEMQVNEYDFVTHDHVEGDEEDMNPQSRKELKEFDHETNNDDHTNATAGPGQVTDLSSPSTKVSTVEHPDRDWLWGSIDPQPTAHTAGKDYAPREQRTFIDEEGPARNLSKLDLSGTHYLEDPDMEDQFLFGV